MTFWGWLGVVAGALASISAILAAVIKVIRFLKKIDDRIAALDKIETYIQQNDKICETMGNLQKEFHELNMEFKDHCESQTKQTRLIVEVSRDLLLNEMEKAIAKKYAPTSQKRRVSDLFAEYSNNGGNHGLGEIYHIFEKLPDETIQPNNNA